MHIGHRINYCTIIYCYEDKAKTVSNDLYGKIVYLYHVDEKPGIQKQQSSKHDLAIFFV